MGYIRYDNSISKLINHQRRHMLYLYAILITIATTTLKFTQFGIANMKRELAQW